MSSFYQRPITPDEIYHHGVKGQKRGVRNGPPYPIKRDASGKPIDKKAESSNIIKDAIEKGIVSLKLNIGNQKKHLPIYKGKGFIEGKSYLFGDLKSSQELINKYAATGEAILSRKNEWTHRERIVADKPIGVRVFADGKERVTNKATIHYGKKGTHIVPR